MRVGISGASRALWLVVAIVMGQAGSVQAQSADRPNVVLIVTDDVGYSDIGSYGAPDIRRPTSTVWRRTARD